MLYRPNSIIRWAGSKKKLLKVLFQFVPFEYNKYLEPFAGSATLFFALNPRTALINDINPELMHFYESVKEDPKTLYDYAKLIPRTREEYNRVRRIRPKALQRFERAGMFFYLNRLCYNGVYRTNRNGQFNVPMGTKLSPFPSLGSLIRASRQLQNATILCGDFESTIVHIERGDLVYVDPPYTLGSGRHQYLYGKNCFTVDDLPRLISFLNNVDRIGATFILSYCENNYVRAALRNYTIVTTKTRRSVSGKTQDRKSVREFIISNRETSVPELPIPS